MTEPVIPILRLGETSRTAYRGDRGKIAYDHSQIPHAVLRPWEFVASEYGMSSSASGAVNAAALNAAILAAFNYGGGVVVLPVGTNELATTSSTYTRPGSVGNNKRYCILIRSGVTIKGAGKYLTHLKLAASQQTNSIIVHMFWADNGVNDWAISDMKITGNTAGQPDYTGLPDLALYTGGDTAGTLIAAGGGVLGTGNERVTLENLILEENFGSAMDVVFPTKWEIRNVDIDKVGEGMLVNGYDQMTIQNCIYNNSTGVSVGDAFEIANGSSLTMTGCKAFDAEAGSALDITGRGITITNIECRRCQNGILIQTDAATESFPNSDMFTVVGCVVADGDAVGIAVAANHTNGDLNGLIANCVVKNMSQGYLISGQTTYGIGTVTMNNCIAVGHNVCGLHILPINKLVVNGGYFGDSDTAGYGIILNGAVATAAGQQKVYIYDATVTGNDRFGVYVSANTDGVTYFPEGIVRVNAFNNSTGDMTYFNGLNGMSYEGIDIYFKNNDHTGLELTNTRLDEVTPVNTHTRVVTGYKKISWNNLKLRQLQQGFDGQELEIAFPVICTVEALSTTAGNNVELDSDESGDSTFAIGDNLTLRYDATDEVWKEVRKKWHYQLPFAPDQVAGYRCWWKSNAGLYQDVSGTSTPASSTNDRVGTWVPQGTGPNFVATGSGVRPRRSAGGGIYGNGSTEFLQTLALSLPAPYTIVFRHEAPSAYFTLQRFFSLDNGTTNWQLFESNSLQSTSAFYENLDVDAYALSTNYYPLVNDLVVGVGVALGGATTGYKSDGTTISMGSTASSGSNSLYALSYLGSTFGGTIAMRDIIIIDALISQSDFQQLQAFLL